MVQITIAQVTYIYHLYIFITQQEGDGPDKVREKLKVQRESLKHLSLKAIELLQVLLEETHEDSSHLIVGFTEDVDLNVIVKVMFQWEVDYKDIVSYTS